VLQFMLEKLGEHLSAHGMITDIVLRSDRSLVAEEELQEVIISFAASEEEHVSVASIHLFSLPDQASCEVEVEVLYPGVLGSNQNDQSEQLWERARVMIPEISLTEKRRYLEPGKMAEAVMILDYHFVVEQPITEDEELQLENVLERFSSDLGKLVSFSK